MNKSIIFLFSLLLVSQFIVSVQSPTSDDIKYLELPSNSIPMGIAYNPKNNMTYVALNWGSAVYGNGEIAEINTTSRTYILYELESWHLDYKYPMPFAVAIDGDGNVWVTIRSFKNTPNQHPLDMLWCIVKFNIESKTIEYIPLSLPSLRGSETVTFYNDYIWTMNKEYLTKIDYITNTIEGCWNVSFSGYFAIGDNYSNDSLWFSSITNNVVCMFNTTTNTVEEIINGFDRPLGVAVDKDYVYVAENHIKEPYEPIVNGTIARIDKTIYTVDRIVTNSIITNEGPYSVLKDSYGNLWWTDNSNNIGVFSLIENLTLNAIGSYCYFMTEVPNSSIWFSCVGSAHIGEITGPKTPDVNSDGKVSIADIVITISAFGSEPESETWNSSADVNSDNRVSITDIVIVINYFGLVL